MSYHIVNIDSANCSLTCRDGQLTCRTETGERKLPMEDVASIVISSFSATLHSRLFLEAARHGVAIILCESHKPASVMLPANRSTDTLLTRAQVSLPERTRQSLWQRTVEAKCRNQWLLARHLSPDDPSLEAMKAVALGKRPHKEPVCAKFFWQVLGRALGERRFARDRARPGLNSLLNYGYAVLLSTMLQKLFAVGLDPTFGISHALRERSTPLAYDLMEPFRPCVDWRVFQWVKEHPEPAQREVTKEFKRWVTGFAIERVDYLDFNLEIQGCIEGMARGFRRAVLDDQLRQYRPWTPKEEGWPCAVKEAPQKFIKPQDDDR